MNIFTKKYFIVLFILPFIGINVIDGNILLSSASKMVVSIIGYLMLFENFNFISYAIFIYNPIFSSDK